MDARAASALKSEPYSPARGLKLLRKLFLRICSLSNTPVSIRAYHAMREGDWEYLTNIPIDPFFYAWNGREEHFETDYQIAAFFKKFQDSNLGIDKKAAAFEKWLKAEDRCRETNKLFRDRWGGGSKPLSFPVEEVLHLARRKITGLLGSFKARDFDRVRDGSRHGPGSDLSCPKHLASSYEKYRTTGNITEPCTRLYDDVFGNEGNPSLTDLWPGELIDKRQELAHDAQYVYSSRLSFVAKTARIDRPICVEPRWNVFLQLGIGEVIAERLRRCGIDIQCQNRNQELAGKAYDDGLATIDLSSASDSVSTNLVIDLLSEADPIWLDLLLKSRCPYTRFQGKNIRLEKISSMGNGYTFPLETLIFYAFAWATCRFLRVPTVHVSVYGDDIIVPRAASSLLIETLQCFGFAVNTDKSYTNGTFFESCGKDYLRGREVRPFFVEKIPVSLSDYFVLHNQVVAWSEIDSTRVFRRSLYNLASVVRTAVIQGDRLFGPTSVGGCFHTPFDVWSTRSIPVDPRLHSGWEGCRIKVLRDIPPRKWRNDPKGLLYSKLSRPSGPGHWVITHGSIGTLVEWIIIPVIEDFFFDTGPPPYTELESPDDADAVPTSTVGRPTLG
jgi:hypothetical protein